MSTQPEPLIPKTGPTAPSDLVKVNAALEEVKGDRTLAARLLGVDKGRVEALIKWNPTLKNRWAEKPSEPADAPALTEDQMITRVQTEPLAKSNEEKMAVALVMSERKMSKSLRKLGFGATEIDAISSIEEFAGAHFSETLSIMHGGMLKGAMRLMMLSDRIEQTYLQDDTLEDKDRRYWWDTYFRILESLRSMHDQANKAALTKAMIDIKKNEGKGGGKPGFSPLSAIQINVTDKNNVTIVTPNDQSDGS